MGESVVNPVQIEVTQDELDAIAATKGLPIGLTGATQATRYVGATASGAPASGTFAIGDFVIDRTGKVWICTVAGTPGTWVNASGTRTIRKAADETVNNSSVLQNDDELLFAIAANEVRRFQFDLFVATGDAAGDDGDFFAALTVPAGATFVAGMTGPGTAATAATAGNGSYRSLSVSGSGKAVGLIDSDFVPICIKGTVVNGATPGNVTLQWCQSVATIVNTTVKAGSFVTHELLG